MPICVTNKEFQAVKVELDGTTHDIVFWRDYGVVCPSLWTTNGSFAYVAYLLAGYTQRFRMNIISHNLPGQVDFSNIESIYNAMSTKYKEWNK